MFEAPLFLVAAAAGATVPLVLHLAHSRRAAPAVFPTLRFLREAQRSSARRVRMEHVLLWLLRTLIMVLLGTAFAMPVLRARGTGMLGRAARDVAIVLDVSYSMEYQAGRETVWTRARDTAAGLVEGLGENDRFCIYLAGETPRPLVAEPIGDREAGLARLRDLQPGHETSRLAPAIEVAYRALRAVPQRRPREIHVLTDNQALAWRAAGTPGTAADGTPLSADGPAWRPDEDDRDTAVFVTLLGVAAPQNATVLDVALDPPVLFAGGGGRLTARLGFSGTPRDTTVSLYVNDAELARRSVRLGTAEGGRVEFAVPALPAGVHTARVETPRDNLPVDDAFHFLVRVRDAQPALVVGPESDTFFVRAALRAAAGTGPAATWTPDLAPDPEALDGHACVFLCNALPLPGQGIEALDRFVEQGGLLVLFPGLRAGVEDYGAWTSLPGVPVGIRDMARASAGPLAAVWSDPRHPLATGLGGASAAPAIALRRRLEWDAWAPDAQVLLAVGPGYPFLVERPFGEGRVLMFAVGADRAWSNLPLTPLFLPIVAQLVEYGAGLGAAPSYLWGREGMPLSAFLPDAASGVRLLDPQGQAVPLRGAMQEGQRVLYAEQMRAPGIYRIAGPDGPRPAAAVNMPREESDLAPLTPREVAERLGGVQARIAQDREELQSLLHEHRVGRTYGELLLWVALLLVGVEFLYANRLARPPGVSRVSVEPSGRVHGHGAAATGTAAGGGA